MQFELAIDDYFFLTPATIGTIELKQLLGDLKPMQKRRLSHYAKLAMGSLLQLEETSFDCNEGQGTPVCELVFASRHGDFHKTSELLDTLASKQEISPTAFSLSVHNAVSGLYSIFKNKKIPITAISAGRDTFLSALIEAYIRIHTKRLDKVILIYVDQPLPDHYQCFADENQQGHAAALVLSANSNRAEGKVRLSFDNTTDAETSAEQNTNHCLMFCEWFTSAESHLVLSNQRANWVVKKL
ncbi:beta-ketoacyl synthase chain length factor [Pseudoalteromonas obscura]|uniref:Beta-ketoacyl synthase chain length factor n=1 Tax=Pseudoalteromonas obscura TaxID=3048491 RepID=A0ABT7ETW3_9GAMM|nr:beta-ketoacyl synthase chain length factor [Pseudoalteromonas sp. P94(2023)]MDK2598486.1 beta-ketoacyl synthase chain length factor [Pseudoalteromonas sp. P94(2023)]